jgi:hypothetical protein
MGDESFAPVPHRLDVIGRHKRIQMLYWMHQARRDLVLKAPFQRQRQVLSRCVRRCGRTRSLRR